jgi:threonine/homoserine/homoserine lactone efflux protein
MTIETWLLYVAAVLVLTVTPGPSVLMCVTSGVNDGARRTLFAALGSITSVVGIMTCSAIGVGAVLATSETLFSAIKWFGVAYLFYLGVTALRSGASSFSIDDTQKVKAGRGALYLKGLLVGASNPKALLFFTAFFPQFLNPAAAQLPQFLILGLTFVCFELFWLMFYAAFASRIAPWLKVRGRAKVFNQLSGVVFIVASLMLATAKRVSK